MSVISLRSAVCACTLLLASFSSHAGLIINGDFESHTLNKNSWTWLNSSLFDGWGGSNIEIWHALQGVEAVSGKHFIELNADGGNSGDWSIFQSFATEIGQQYQLSFYYRARTGNSERFKVSLANMDWLLSDHTTAGWTPFSNTFIATANNTTLRFTSQNKGTYGNFIDAVQVSALPVTSQVPEPATLAAFGLGLLGLVAGRRLRQRK